MPDVVVLVINFAVVALAENCARGVIVSVVAVPVLVVLIGRVSEQLATAAALKAPEVATEMADA